MTVSLQGSLMVDIAGKWLTAEDRHLLRQPRQPAPGARTVCVDPRESP